MPLQTDWIGIQCIYGPLSEGSPVLIDLKDYPQLALIAWNRLEQPFIEETEALALYERNWRYVDQAALQEPERQLINQLASRHGNNVLNV
jgi:hypothetical protein